MNPSLTKSAFASSKGDLGVSFLLLSLVFFVQGEFSFLQNLLCFCLNVFKGISGGSLCHWLKYSKTSTQGHPNTISVQVSFISEFFRNLAKFNLI
jgi:hypothetical protein